MQLSQTMDKLHAMKLLGMASALSQQTQKPDIGSLSFDERFAMLVDTEWIDRENRKTQRKLSIAKFRIQEACIEDINWHQGRKLDKSLIHQLARCDWVHKHLNVLITGATGIGKSFIACALGNSACRRGFTTFYCRTPRLFHDLSIAKGDGSYGKRLATLAKYHLLIIDDFALADTTEENRQDFLEIIEDRYDRKSTIVASQMPVKNWHEKIGDPTIADAIMDRLVHNAYKIHITGKDSMREQKKKELLDSSRPGKS